MRMIFTLLTALALTAGAATALALPGLKHEDDLNDRLFVVSVADKIRRECDSISARMFRALSYMQSIKTDAEARGYSGAEIEAYVKNRGEKAKMRERRDAYFRSKGASDRDPQSLCRLGRDEIAGSTAVGALLREN